MEDATHNTESIAPPQNPEQLGVPTEDAPPPPLIADPPPRPPPADPDEKVCFNCETRHTPLWRLSREDGQWRCNACGIYLKHKHMERPLSLATNAERSARSAAAAQARRAAASPKLPRADVAGSGAHASGWDSDDDASSSGTEPLRKSTRVRKPVCRDLSPSPPPQRSWRSSGGGGRNLVIDRDAGWMGEHQPGAVLLFPSASNDTAT